MYFAFLYFVFANIVQKLSFATNCIKNVTYMNIKNTISLNIKYLIVSNNLTQETFGILFGVTRGMVGHWVSGRTTPDIIQISEICSYFNISIDKFINVVLSESKNYNIGISASAILANEPGYGSIVVSELEEQIKTLEKENSSLKNKLITAYEKIDELKEELEQKNNDSGIQKGA